MSRVAKIVVEKFALKWPLLLREICVKTGCKAASRLQVDLAPLFAVLPKTVVAETAHTAQADSSTATEKVGFRASSPQLTIPGLEAVIFSEETPV